MSSTNNNNNSRWDDCIDFVLMWEGGYVYHPNDRGGETNRGITRSVFIDSQRKGIIPATTILKNMTKEEAKRIYKVRYWDNWDWGSLPYTISLCMLDITVNHGSRGMAFIVQRALNKTVGCALTVDGMYGKNTKDALFKYCSSAKDIVETRKLAVNICDFRKDYYDRIIRNNKSQEVFRKGWYNRVEALRKKVMSG